MSCVPPAWHASLYLLPYHLALEPFTSLGVPWGQYLFFDCCISSNRLCGWLNKYLLNGTDLEGEKECKGMGQQRDRGVSTGWNFRGKPLQRRWEIAAILTNGSLGRQVREGDLRMAYCVPHYSISFQIL